MQRITTCENCGIIFDGSLENITVKHLYRESDGFGQWFFYTECPLCKNKEEVPSEDGRYCWDDELKKRARELNIKTMN